MQVNEQHQLSCRRSKALWWRWPAITALVYFIWTAVSIGVWGIAGGSNLRIGGPVFLLAVRAAVVGAMVPSLLPGLIAAVLFHNTLKGKNAENGGQWQRRALALAATLWLIGLAWILMATGMIAIG